MPLDASILNFSVLLIYYSIIEYEVLKGLKPSIMIASGSPGSSPCTVGFHYGRQCEGMSGNQPLNLCLTALYVLKRSQFLELNFSV